MAEPATAAHWLRPGTLTLTALPPLSLYVHLPWCLRKCPYCDFNSHELGAPARAGAQADVFERYLQALRCDLEAALPMVWGRRVVSVFIGGGTPSLFTPEAIGRLLGDVRALLKLEAECEITLEANPGTFEKERFRGYRAAGVTRLSVGVQSFDDAALAALGRVHDGARRPARALVEVEAPVRPTPLEGRLVGLHPLDGGADRDQVPASSSRRCSFALASFGSISSAFLSASFAMSVSPRRSYMA
ncbi:MAG TPA: radical SAM protein, partial [Burkholderiaceae bacterium]|nr:radical SAM protein [Burkholderiaceae bacterium]